MALTPPAIGWPLAQSVARDASIGRRAASTGSGREGRPWQGRPQGPRAWGVDRAAHRGAGDTAGDAARSAAPPDRQRRRRPGPIPSRLSGTSSAGSPPVGRSSVACPSDWPARPRRAVGCCSTGRSRSTSATCGPVSHLVIAHFCDAWHPTGWRPTCRPAHRLGHAGRPGSRSLHRRVGRRTHGRAGRSDEGSRSTRGSSAGDRARSLPVHTASTSRSSGTARFPARSRRATRHPARPDCWRSCREPGARRRRAWPTASRARPTRSSSGCTRSRSPVVRPCWPGCPWNRWPRWTMAVASSWRPSRPSAAPHHPSPSDRDEP